LSKTLASPEKTAALVSSITEKDEKTGQTYLKIPLESQEALTNVLSLVGNLFGGGRNRYGGCIFWGCASAGSVWRPSNKKRLKIFSTFASLKI
jgi:hypothetical protein